MNFRLDPILGIGPSLRLDDELDLFLRHGESATVLQRNQIAQNMLCRDNEQEEEMRGITLAPDVRDKLNEIAILHGRTKYARFARPMAVFARGFPDSAKLSDILAHLDGRALREIDHHYREGNAKPIVTRKPEPSLTVPILRR